MDKFRTILAMIIVVFAVLKFGEFKAENDYTYSEAVGGIKEKVFDDSNNVKDDVSDNNLGSGNRDEGNVVESDVDTKVGEQQDANNQTEADNQSPVITLLGETHEEVEFKSHFTDPGYTVTDNVDVNIDVMVSGSVNTSLRGTYTITYSAEDNAGNEVSVNRTVTVLNPNPYEISIEEALNNVQTNEVSIIPVRVAYDGTNVVMQTIIVNSTVHSVRYIPEARVILNNGDNSVIADAYFFDLDFRTDPIQPNTYIYWSFTYDSSTVLLQNSSLDLIQYTFSLRYNY